MKTIAVLAALAASVSAWEITWFWQADCEGYSSHYSGSGVNEQAMNSCIQPGEPGLPTEGCVWQTFTGDEPCTVPTRPVPKSFIVGDDTRCLIGPSDSCPADDTFSKSNTNKCINTDDVLMDAKLGRPMWFQCMLDIN